MNVIFTIKKEQILLRANELNYELCRLNIRKDRVTGETYEEWVPFKFFASLERALNRVIDLKVRASDASTLAELRRVIEDSRDEVCRTWATGTQGQVTA